MKWLGWVFLTVVCVAACAGSPKPRVAAPAMTRPAVEPALPYGLYLKLIYRHRTMDDPLVMPRDFEQQV